MSEQPSENPTPKAIANERLGKWQAVVEAELQDLVKQASTLRKSIDTSKTVTKKNYYKKKFSKVSTEVLRMVAAMQGLEQQSTQLNTPNDDATAPTA